MGAEEGKIKQKPIFPYIHCLWASDVGLLTLIFRAGQPGYQQQAVGAILSDIPRAPADVWQHHKEFQSVLRTNQGNHRGTV